MSYNDHMLKCKNCGHYNGMHSSGPCLGHVSNTCNCKYFVAPDITVPVQVFVVVKTYDLSVDHIVKRLDLSKSNDELKEDITLSIRSYVDYLLKMNPPNDWNLGTASERLLMMNIFKYIDAKRAESAVSQSPEQVVKLTTPYDRLLEAENQFLRDCGWTEVTDSFPPVKDKWLAPDSSGFIWDRVVALAQARMGVQTPPTTNTNIVRDK